MNSTAYIFGSLGEGYIQYPDDYTHGLFYSQSLRLSGNTLFACHREGELMHYSGFFRIGGDNFIGFGIVTNGAMVNNHHVLMQIFQDTLDFVVARGYLLRRIERRIEIGNTKLSDLRTVQTVVEHLRYLVQQIDRRHTMQLPPLSYELGQGSEVWFRYDKSAEEVALESARYANTYLSELGEKTIPKTEPTTPQKTTPPPPPVNTQPRYQKKKKHHRWWLYVLILLFGAWLAIPYVRQFVKTHQQQGQETIRVEDTAQIDRLRKAAELYNAEQFNEAFELYSILANEGNTVAQYQLGQLYRLGQGTEKNYKEAVSWYKASAQSGNAEAQYRLGVMMYYGEGVQRSRKEGLEWIRKAAKQNHTKALEALGQL